MALTRWKKSVVAFASIAIIAASAGLGTKTKAEAHRLVTNPHKTRMLPRGTPADRQMPYEEVTVKTSDGLNLVGWFVPSFTDALVITVHGYKDNRGSLVGVAELLRRRGFSVLIPSMRAHDRSDGELVSFGVHEMKDLQAWYEYARSRPDVDPQKIGLFGVSLGGTLAIQYTAENPEIRALIADCAFSSVRETVETSVAFFTGLPPFPFASMILFWMEREVGFDAEEIDAKRWIPRISPRPVFLLQGGADVVVWPESGAKLYEAALQPKELWFDAELGHAQFLSKRPQEFEERVTGFFERHLRGRSH